MLLLFKLTLAPLLVALATLVARRWGPEIGGVVVGLPLSTGPIFLFLAIDQGLDFAESATDAGIPWALSMWTDRTFFMNNVKISLGARADAIPAEFLADRERLFDAPLDVAGMRAAMPQTRDQFRAQIGWIEAQLGDGRPWLLGPELSLADISAYMIVWHLRTSLTDGEAIDVAGLDPIFRSSPRTLAWERRMQAIGHGERTELSAEDALDIAARATPQTAIQARCHRARRLWESGSDGIDRRAVGPTHCHCPPRGPGWRHDRPFPAGGFRRASGMSAPSRQTGKRSAARRLATALAKVALQAKRVPSLAVAPVAIWWASVALNSG